MRWPKLKEVVPIIALNEKLGVNKLFTGQKGPERTVVATDPQTSGLIDKRIEQSQRPVGDYAAELNKDAEGGLAAMQTDQSAQQEDAQMGGDPGIMSGAIRSKFNQVANKDLMRLKNKNDLQASLNKSQDMRKAWDMHMARQNIMTMNYEKLFKANSDAANARAAVLGQAMNVAGQAGGMWAANRNWSQPSAPAARQPNMAENAPDTSGYGSAGESGTDFSNLA